MNSNSSPDTSSVQSGGVSAEAISRRAYELWEAEGRPDGSDVRHWVQAEQELSGKRSAPPSAARYTDSPRAAASDSRPLQGNRTTAAAPRDTKRASNSPFTPEKTASNGGSLAGGRRRN